MVLYPNMTSSAVNSTPSVHRTPFLRWNVITKPSFDISHVSARLPMILRSVSYLTRPLNISPATSCDALSPASMGINILGSPIEPSIIISP